MLKLHSSLIAISFLGFGFCVGLSMMFKYAPFTLFESYLVGIACSLIVVGIASFVQYKHTKEQYRKEIYGSISDILERMFFLFIKGYSDNPEVDYHELSKRIDRIRVITEDSLFEFVGKKAKAYEDLFTVSYSTKLDQLVHTDSAQRLVKIVTKENYMKLAKATTVYYHKRYAEEIYRAYVDRIKMIETHHPAKLYLNEKDYYDSFA